MADWQLDAMYEAQSAEMWEDLHTDYGRGEDIQTAGKILKEALYLLDKAEEQINEAGWVLEGLAVSDKVFSFENEVGFIRYKLTQMQDNFERGLADE